VEEILKEVYLIWLIQFSLIPNSVDFKFNLIHYFIWAVEETSHITMDYGTMNPDYFQEAENLAVSLSGNPTYIEMCRYGSYWDGHVCRCMPLSYFLIPF